MSDATDNPSLVCMVVLSYLLKNNYLKKLKLFQLLSSRSGLLVYTKQTVRGFYLATAFHLAWANCGHLETLPLVSPRNDICEMKAEISRTALLQPVKSITQIWVVTHHQNVIYSAISALVSQASFRREPESVSWNVGCFLRLHFISGLLDPVSWYPLFFPFKPLNCFNDVVISFFGVFIDHCQIKELPIIVFELFWRSKHFLQILFLYYKKNNDTSS